MNDTHRWFTKIYEYYAVEVKTRTGIIHPDTKPQRSLSDLFCGAFAALSVTEKGRRQNGQKISRIRGCSKFVSIACDRSVTMCDRIVSAARLSENAVFFVFFHRFTVYSYILRISFFDNYCDPFFLFCSFLICEKCLFDILQVLFYCQVLIFISANTIL